MGQYVQRSLQAISPRRLHDRGRRLREVVDVVHQHVAVFSQEFASSGEQLVGLLYRVGGGLIRAAEVVSELGQVLVQRNELPVVLMQRVDEQRQTVQHRE